MSAGGVIRKLDHVAIAVRSLPAAVRLFHEVLGGEFIGGGDNPQLRVRAVHLRFPPDMRVELLSPLGPDSYLHRYLDGHGEGFHHMTFYADEVQAAVDHVTANGFEVVDTVVGSPTWDETFLRPSTSFGALIQLARPVIPWTEPLEGVTVDDVLAGHIGVLANHAWLHASGETLLPRSAS